jgi:protein SEY1
MDGVPIFVERSWSTIREQKELNLPDQREMVANYRCNEIKDESYRLVEEKITDLTRISAEKEVLGYKEKCQEVTTVALNHYSKQSRQYDKEVSGKIQLELTEHIMSQLFFSFDS